MATYLRKIVPSGLVARVRPMIRPSNPVRPQGLRMKAGKIRTPPLPDTMSGRARARPDGPPATLRDWDGPKTRRNLADEGIEVPAPPMPKAKSARGRAEAEADEVFDAPAPEGRCIRPTAPGGEPDKGRYGAIPPTTEAGWDKALAEIAAHRLESHHADQQRQAAIVVKALAAHRARGFTLMAGNPAHARPGRVESDKPATLQAALAEAAAQARHADPRYKPDAQASPDTREPEPKPVQARRRRPIR